MKKNKNDITLLHHIGKTTYDLYCFAHKNVKRFGVWFALAIVYSSLWALIEMAPITDLSLWPVEYNPLMACVGITFLYFIIYAWSWYKTLQYYTIKFSKNGLFRNGDYLNLHGKTYNDGNIIYKFKTDMSDDFLLSKIKTLERSLNTKIIDINIMDEYDSIEIVTNKRKRNAPQNRTVKSINPIIKSAGPIIKPVIQRSNKSSFVDLISKVKLNSKNNILIGKDKSNNIITLDIKKMQHSIVAGSTGKGKSNLAHILISSLILSNEDVSLILLDPKKSELKRYKDINRVYYTGEADKILLTLEAVVAEMDRRNKLIETDKFVNNIEVWNSRNPNNKMGYIVVYIEEIADLIISGSKPFSIRFKTLIQRLCQLGRSTGIRMFLSTQKPNAEILPTLIKGNCMTRFGFGVSNISESQVIIDSKECKGLKVGDMILQRNGENIKVSVPFLEDHHIFKVIDYLEGLHNTEGDYPLGEAFVLKLNSSCQYLKICK